MLLGSLLGAVSFYPTYQVIASYSRPADAPLLTALLFAQVFFSSMCYGPLGAFLVEYFPARIRYTSMSISYGIGTGDIGDATLVVAPALVFVMGSVYAGLVWSTVIPLAASVIALLLVKESKETRIWAEGGLMGRRKSRSPESAAKICDPRESRAVFKTCRGSPGDRAWPRLRRYSSTRPSRTFTRRRSSSPHTGSWRPRRG